MNKNVKNNEISDFIMWSNLKTTACSTSDLKRNKKALRV